MRKGFILYGRFNESSAQMLIRLVLYFILGFIVGSILFTALTYADTAPKIVLTTRNTVVLRGVIDDSSVIAAQYKLMEQVLVRGAKPYTIYLVIDSPGGVIDAGLSFIEFAKTIPNLKTISIFAASMASAIAETLPGERLVLANSTMMFHRAGGGFRGHFETGEVEAQLWAAKAMVREMEIINASRMKMTLESYKALAQNELWLYGKNTILYRSADQMVNAECTSSLIKQTQTSTMSFMGLFEVQIDFSGCPLLRGPISTNKASGKYVVPSLRNYNYIKTKYLKQ